jgi:CcdB protein.
MAQFFAYRNLNAANRATIPLLLDVQSGLIATLDTCVVVPLYTEAAMKGKVLKTLTPVLAIDGKRHVMVTPQLAGIPRKLLGAPVADLSAHRADIMAALDMLVSGI